MKGYVTNKAAKSILGFENIDLNAFPLEVEISFCNANGWAYVEIEEMKCVGWEPSFSGLKHLIFDVYKGEIELEKVK